ncbi:MAG: hydrogenase expression/formation protein HypE [Elusimicrobia bacterium]|nr:hydrogenase expression/formation protein HypE [Elusimicrobiota bacterium]
MTAAPEIPSFCPIPISQYPAVLLAHGGGGKLMHELIDKMFVPAFGSSALQSSRDSAVLDLPGTRLAFTTDSYVVRPLFFPGGDIGDLAVNGTVNDLAMSGARPLYLSAGFVIEEGLPMETLWRVVQSMKEAAERAHVQIVTGDTKVVDRGKGDGLYINTSGVGAVEHAQTIAPERVRAGDALIVNGDIGRHGIAVMALREGLEFESAIESDTAPLADLVLSLLSGGIEVHALRDLTRGGLASALNEIASASGVSVSVEEKAIPVREDVRGACEMLGFDPLYVANEGRLAAFVKAEDAARALSVMRAHPQGAGAALIGRAADEPGAPVTLVSRIGTRRIVDMLSGEQFPRIC